LHDVPVSVEYPEGDAERGVANPGQRVLWVVWRQDDNGNQYEVTRKDSRAEAEEIAAVMEARGHKQTYWVAKAAW
jgi:hypothetical protein